MGEFVLVGQSVILTREVATTGASIDDEILEDLGRDADLYIFNQDVMQDYYAIESPNIIQSLYY